MATIIKEASELPPVTRNSGRNSEERTLIQSVLSSGKPGLIEDVPKNAEYLALQQRIRTAGKAMNPPVNVSIRTAPKGKTKIDDVDVDVVDLYFIDGDKKDEFVKPVAEKAPAKAPAKAKAAATK